MRVCMSLFTGNYFALEVEPQDTIGHIIDQYLLKEKIEKSDLFLIYHSTTLESNKTLEQYKIEDGSILQLLYKINGGGTEVDFTIDGSKIQNISTSNEAKPFRIIYEGINVEGYCKNSGCLANGERVIIPMKDKTTIDFVSKDNNFMCPICHEKVEPVTCGFYKCKFSFIGETSDDER